MRIRGALTFLLLFFIFIIYCEFVMVFGKEELQATSTGHRKLLVQESNRTETPDAAAICDNCNIKTENRLTYYKGCNICVALENCTFTKLSNCQFDQDFTKECVTKTLKNCTTTYHNCSESDIQNFNNTSTQSQKKTVEKSQPSENRNEQATQNVQIKPNHPLDKILNELPLNGRRAMKLKDKNFEEPVKMKEPEETQKLEPLKAAPATKVKEVVELQKTKSEVPKQELSNADVPKTKSEDPTTKAEELKKKAEEVKPQLPKAEEPKAPVTKVKEIEIPKTKAEESVLEEEKVEAEEPKYDDRKEIVQKPEEPKAEESLSEDSTELDEGALTRLNLYKADYSHLKVNMTMIVSPEDIYSGTVSELKISAVVKAVKTWSFLSKYMKVLVCVEKNTTMLNDFIESQGLTILTDYKRGDLSKTPTIPGLVESAEQRTNSSLVFISNADIIFGPDVLWTVTAVQDFFKDQKFVIHGNRWNTTLNQTDDLLTSEAKWPEQIEEWRNRGYKFRDNAQDYFIFPRSTWNLQKIPPLSIGFPSWDNFLVNHAYTRCIPLVDVTETLTAIHSDHGKSLWADPMKMKVSNSTRLMAKAYGGWRWARISQTSLWKTVFHSGQIKVVRNPTFDKRHFPRECHDLLK